MVEFLFDENLSHYYAESINALEQSRGANIVRSTKVALNKSDSDEDIVKYAITQNHSVIIIAQDKDFTKKNLYQQIMKSSNVGLILIKFPKGYKFWDQIQMIYKHWVKIRDLPNSHSVPFSFRVRYNKIQQV